MLLLEFLKTMLHFIIFVIELHDIYIYIYKIHIHIFEEWQRVIVIVDLNSI